MKIRLIILLIILFVNNAYCQEIDSLRFQERQRKITFRGMSVLGLWAIGNIGTGIAGSLNHTGEAGYTAKMNGAINLVNVGLALPAFIKASRPLALKPEGQSFEDAITTEKILLFNSGLDISYVLLGQYLQERSKTHPENAAMLKGYGKSLALQGAFLWLFDTSMHFVYLHNRRQYQKRLRLAKS